MSASPPPPFDLGRLPSSVALGEGCRIYAHEVDIGAGSSIGDGVVLVSDSIRIGEDVTIEAGADVRAGSIEIGDRSELKRGTRILVAERFSIGAAGRICAGVQILCREFVAGRLLYLGDGVNVGYGGTTTSTARVRFGDRITIGQHTILNANFPIDIGDDVGTGSYLSIWTHGYHFGHGPLLGFPPTYAPVQIGRNVWLGFHVTILPGVSIGENSIIAAGSVVTREVPPNVLAAGVPARAVKQLEMSPLEDSDCFAMLTELLRTWHGELSWKGVRAEIESQHEVLVMASSESPATRFRLLRDSDTLPGTNDSEVTVLVSVDGSVHLDDWVREPHCAFTLRSGRISGGTSPIIEDFRDYLRRHAMPCGDDRCFASISPVAFSRLEGATRGG